MRPGHGKASTCRAVLLSVLAALALLCVVLPLLMLSLFTYIALIVGVNFAFTVTPLIPLPNGEMWAPLSLIVGFIFVVRDFAQRRVGHHGF